MTPAIQFSHYVQQIIVARQWHIDALLGAGLVVSIPPRQRNSLLCSSTHRHRQYIHPWGANDGNRRFCSNTALFEKRKKEKKRKLISTQNSFIINRWEKVKCCLNALSNQHFKRKVHLSVNGVWVTLLQKNINIWIYNLGFCA